MNHFQLIAMPLGTVNNIKEAYLKFYKFVLMKIRIKRNNFGWLKKYPVFPHPKMYLCDLKITVCTGTWIAVWKTHGRLMELAQSFWEWIFFGRALWAVCSSTWIQATEMQLCCVWRHSLISRSHSDVSPSLYLIQIAFSLIRFPKLCQGK